MAADVEAYARWIARDTPPSVRARSVEVARLVNRSVVALGAGPPTPASGEWDDRVPYPTLRELSDSGVSSLLVSLRDPLSQRLIVLPVRSVRCEHQQAFDALAHWKVNEQVDSNPLGLLDPNRWKCPCCGVTARPDSLVLSPLFCAALLRLGLQRAAATRGSTLADVLRVCDRVKLSADGWWCLASSRTQGTECIDLTVDEPDLGEIRVKLEPADHPPASRPRARRRASVEAAAAAGLAAIATCPPPLPSTPVGQPGTDSDSGFSWEAGPGRRRAAVAASRRVEMVLDSSGSESIQIVAAHRRPQRKPRRAAPKKATQSRKRAAVQGASITDLMVRQDSCAKRGRLNCAVPDATVITLSD
eukprot:TRINITY_DN6318_c0_g1_i1.p2 TRINITY_DN6318_c0_g1~~TRINITY_DN6318_c0_g1_i1.p2  ORF type:complete len:360 (+),score=88.22 TRINITY_DN6318_c0_g1_i1:63-1142(+)